MSDDAGGRLGRRLRRILLLLPYAIRNPGVSVAELSEKFGVKQKDLVEDLELLFLCGLPGYGPGDLIDVAIDDERVYVRMADYFGTPLRLTPAEALTLYAGGAAIADLPGMEGADALRRALAKLGRALGAGQEQTTDTGISVRVETGAGTHLEELSRAVTQRKRVDIEYLSASRGQLTSRRVDPWGLVTALGRWYLVAWDHDSSDERMFRVDRVKSVTLTDEDAEVPEDFDPSRYRGAFLGGGEQEVISFEISPSAARWFEDYYPVKSSTPAKGGWQRVELISGGHPWAAALIARLGSDVRSVKPPEVLGAAQGLAREIAARHSG